MRDFSRLRLFEAYGVELEYMIVDKQSFDVKPVADKLFHKLLGTYGNEVEFPVISWSNELALHIVEFKTTIPHADFDLLAEAFHKNVLLANEKLGEMNARLLPTAAHPWMNPMKETCIWQHENSEIYQTYNKIFDCRGHGWSNLQSTHLNLPFQGDMEFGRLHAAIRLLLPILPALSASSPIMDRKFTGFYDTRLKYYQENQKRIPSITARVIPEPVYSQAEYQAQIFDTISADVATFDPLRVLEPIWLNSRGAIARFDRGSIEIRIIDIQECPAADLAILAFLVDVLKLLVEEDLVSYQDQSAWDTEMLYSIFNTVVEQGEKAVIRDEAYLRIFGMNNLLPVRAKDIWQYLLELLLKNNAGNLEPWKSQLTVILNEGTLSNRILKALDNDYSKENLQLVYKKLSKCLRKNIMFIA
ncbi:MAG: carboxylate-amine ligase [Candidatus Cyclobacteriaceae bacterium M3_2C_046]